MKVLVTGSAGEVGSALLPQLAQRCDVVGFDRRPPSGEWPALQGDLTVADEVHAALDGVDAVVHLAALLPQNRPPADFVELNVTATANVLQAAVDRGVRRLAYCSSVWASGQGLTEPYLPIDEDVPCAPVCLYGQTKWLGELMCEWYARRYGLETVILRFCGYHAVRGYDAEGRIDWATADLPALFGRYLGAGFKLMNPVDLGSAFGAAVTQPAAAGRRFVVGCYTPYVAADAAGLRSLPAAVVERYYPGVPALLDELGVAPPPVNFYFRHEAARTQLGFRSQHDLGDLARLYRQWRAGQ